MVRRELRVKSSGCSAVARRGIGQDADDPVEADPRQPHLRLERRRGIADEDDLAVGGEDVARVLGEAPVEADVQRALEVPVREVGGAARVDERGAGGRAPQHLVERERCRGAVLGEQLARLTVALRVEREVGGS